MITIRTWIISVLAATGLLSVGYSAQHHFVPTSEDIKDPLGRPSALSLELIDSSSRLDALTAEMVPKHAKLAGGMAEMNYIADDLSVLVDDAGQLPVATAGLVTSTGEVVSHARPLPDQLAEVTDNTKAAPSKTKALGRAVDGVTGELRRIDHNLRALSTALEPLQGQTDQIAAVLKKVEAETSRLAPLMALLRSVPARHAVEIIEELLGSVLAQPKAGTGAVVPVSTDVSSVLSSLAGGE